MKEFDYDLDYKSLDFTDAETRKLYRIGRGEQGVLVRSTLTIYAYWRFVDEPTVRKSVIRYTKCSVDLKTTGLHWYGHGAEILGDGFYRARRHVNHSSGRKYDKMSGKVRPQDTIGEQIQSKGCCIFKEVRDKAAYDPEYQRMRRSWRENE